MPSLEQVLVPCLCFGIIVLYHLFEWRRVRSKGPRGFFGKVRRGWVQDNFMKGQAAANTTRDYIRVTVFASSTAVLLATFAAGTAASIDSGKELLPIKLYILSGWALVIFLAFMQATRFVIHFHFLINVSHFDGVPTTPQLMENTFSHAHKFYSVGIRAYFLIIPLTFWVISYWALLGATPFYLYTIHQLESTDHIREDLEHVEAEKARLKADQESDEPAVAAV